MNEDTDTISDKSEPVEHNELVTLIENNDASVAANIIQETHTPNRELRELKATCEKLSKRNSVENPTIGQATKCVLYDWFADQLEGIVDE